MMNEFRAPDWQDYRMTYGDPHRRLEEPAAESAVVEDALSALENTGVLPHTEYDGAKFLAFREAVRKKFEIPWTAITPRMQRLIWAINAIGRPRRMIAAGIFCGNTFISNAGAAVGPGSVYEAEDLVGVEIKPAEAERAARNVGNLDNSGVARIVATDAVEFVAAYQHPIDLLYLDADGGGKSVYLDIVEAAYEKLPDGALVLAHNSVNAAERLRHYLAFVRDETRFAVSVNMIVDGEGLEVTRK